MANENLSVKNRFAPNHFADKYKVKNQYFRTSSGSFARVNELDLSALKLNVATYPKTSAYLASNKKFADLMWQNPRVVRVLLTRPQLLSDIEEEPSIALNQLMAENPTPYSASSSSSCCVVL